MENQNDINNATLDFDFQTATENHSIIKVVGVGGGGSNAVQHMYEAGIQDVSFLIINTDKQALKGSMIPNKLLISEKGLGAGAKPEVAREFAVQYTDAIKQALSDGTEMVFITAGMGGGTGTGAAPVVAQLAHEMGILTVGIVTIPFRFEGRKKIMMALEGVRAIERWCDALLVVNNNRLIDVYPDLNFGNAFGKADDTLTIAAKSISDIINIQGYINLDFADVSTTLRNGGVALISTGTASGENRLSKAIDAAINSPLLQDNKINDAKHLLFELCFSHDNPISMSEISEMNQFVDSLNSDIEVIWGAMYDDTLGDDVRIILLASGFAMDHSTGGVIANNTMGDKLKDMERDLRLSITEKQSHLSEFDGFPEAYNILLNATRLAINKADNITLDIDLEEESSKLDQALESARECKAQKIAADEAAAEEARRKAEEQQAILDQIAMLQAKLAEANSQAAEQKAVITEEPETAPATAKAEEVQASDIKVDEPVAVKVEEPVKTVEKPAEKPVQPIVEKVAEPAEKAAEKNLEDAQARFEERKRQQAEAIEHKKPTPQNDPLKGLDEIRRFYGDEAANKMMLDDVRKAYYVLDDQELTNEQLIAKLEKLPAYNRSVEDLGQLKAVSRKPATPKVIGNPNNYPDGTIKF